MSAVEATIDNVLRDGMRQLQTVDPNTATLDARLLLQHVLQCDWEDLILNKHTWLSSAELAHWHDVLAQRLRHRPVAKITGQAGFYGALFKTTNDTLDPRPDSETIIAIIERLYEDHTNPLRILDLGTGTGCLLLTLLRLYPHSTGIGADLSDAALAVAMENAATFDLTARAQFVSSNWYSGVTGSFDLIVSNPPYIDHAALATLSAAVRDYDPMLALDGGADGLDAYRIILAGAMDVLRVAGYLVVEIGYDQADTVRDMFSAIGLANVHVYYDLAGHARVVTGQRIR